jgi:EAL domain-containing protein (putative c-di-GMP-specific phosphodiesterase class I)
MQVVAEGIETAEQRDALLHMGCGLGQGYLFAKPLPAERIEQLLRSSALLGPPVEVSLIASPVAGGN